jgi:short-subunit dehydrogenase
MIERRRGWIVFMASVAGKLAVPDESAYVATKFAMVGLAETLSMEVEDAGVHVLTVCPGAVRTDFFDQEALERMPEVARRSMIEPERVIDATLDGLARGKREVTVPKSIRPAYVLRAIAPGILRSGTKRTTMKK